MHAVSGEVVDLGVCYCWWGSGGSIRWEGGGFFGMGGVIIEEKLVVGGGDFFVQSGGCLGGFGCWCVSLILWC